MTMLSNIYIYLYIFTRKENNHGKLPLSRLTDLEHLVPLGLPFLVYGRLHHKNTPRLSRCGVGGYDKGTTSYLLLSVTALFFFFLSLTEKISGTETLQFPVAAVVVFIAAYSFASPLSPQLFKSSKVR